MLEFLAAIPECSSVVVPEASSEAMRYYNSGNILWIVQQAWGLIVPLLFLFWGWTGKMSSFASRWGKNWYLTIIVYLLLFTVFSQLLNFPLDYYTGYIRQHAYGLSTQTVGRWFDIYWKGILVSFFTAAVFIWIFYLLLKKSPRRWWFYGSVATIGIMFIMMLVQPIWIDPLFNQFGPMKNKQLEQQILNLASRAGIENGRVFEVDKSQDTKQLNAYVVGIGSTNRIVLWDTTIDQMNQDEILFVMGHEMGHYVLHHIWWGMAFYSVLTFVIFYLTYRAANYLMHRYHGVFGFDHLSNIASLPLLIFLVSFFMLLSSPLSNYFSRAIEHNADRFGLEITQNNQSAGEAFIALQQENLANPRPGPIFKFWRSTHPPLAERVDFCNRYCPWKEQEPLKYGKYFKE